MKASEGFEMTITEAWLKEREEAAINACPSPWDNRVKSELDNHAKANWVWCNYGWLAECSGISSEENAKHIALNDPASVLAMISAIRNMKEVLEGYANVNHAGNGSIPHRGMMVYLPCSLTAKVCLEELFGEDV